MRSSAASPSCTGRCPTRYDKAPHRTSTAPMTTSPPGSPTWPAACGPPPESLRLPASIEGTDMSLHANSEITLDQQLALKTAATRLARDFAGTFNAETIQRFLTTSYDQFAGR